MRIQEQTRRSVAAQTAREKQVRDIEALMRRWLLFSFPIQEMLKLHLHLYGLSSAQDSTDMLERLWKTMKGTKNEACDARPLPH